MPTPAPRSAYGSAPAPARTSVPRSLVLILRAMLVLAAAGSLVVLFVILPIAFVDAADEPVLVAVAIVGLLALGVICLQVIGVCIWQLLGLVLRRRIFSRAAFCHVDVVTVAMVVIGVLLLAFAAVLAAGAAAPGLVLIVGGAALLAFAAALTVNVARRLLAQAVERDTQARRLEGELSEVI